MAHDQRLYINHEQDRLTIRFPSTMENIDVVDQKSRDFLKSRGLNSEIFSVSLVLREGLTNAVRHAHKSNPQKITSYILKIENDVLIMEIEDQGAGFDWRAAKQREPILDQDHGRGLAIMKRYFSELVYNEQGNKLILKKQIGQL